MSPNRQPGPGQRSLLGPSKQEIDALAEQSAEEYANNVLVRAYYLIGALDALAQTSFRKEGFATAYKIPKHNQEIWEYYDKATPHVVKGAKHRAEGYIGLAKQHFLIATGFTALKGVRLDEKVISEVEVDARANNRWEHFKETYYGPANRDTRNKKRKQLIKTFGDSLPPRETLVKRSRAKRLR